MVPDTTWQKNAASQVVLDSIFAALAAIWLTTIPTSLPTELRFLEVLCSLFSFFLFAISAEGTITAYDEKDVLKFVYYLLWYNIGVIVIGGAIWILIFAQFEGYFLRFTDSLFPRLDPIVYRMLVPLIFIASFIVFLWNWFRDACFIMCKSREGFSDYLKELNDEAEPRPDHHWLMRQIFRKRL